MSLSPTKRDHGLYSSKMRVPLASDTFGKAVQFNATVAPYYEPPRASRDAFKGKQMLTKSHLPPFSKLEYAQEPFDDAVRAGKERKTGFGTSQTLNRDDLSSTLEVGRYRHHLTQEMKFADKVAATSPRGAASPGGYGEDGLAASGNNGEAGGATMRAAGLGATIPVFQNEFDRTRHVAEFSTRRYDPSVKYERVLGSSKPVSHDIGEGASDVNLLKSPALGVRKPGTHSIVHPSPSVLNPTCVS